MNSRQCEFEMTNWLSVDVCLSVCMIVCVIGCVNVPLESCVWKWHDYASVCVTCITTKWSKSFQSLLLLPFLIVFVIAGVCVYVAACVCACVWVCIHMWLLIGFQIFNQHVSAVNFAAFVEEAAQLAELLPKPAYDQLG